jgi:DNA-binding NarL/FixJ family response regulator
LQKFFLNQTNNISILIVDDAVLITQRLAEQMSDIGIETNVSIAHSYDEAWHSIHNSMPAVVLLDIHLGTKSGVELLEAIKEKYPTIYVIMVTNKVAQFYKDLCKEKGADYFIDKSKEFEEIPELIRKKFVSK